MDIRISKTSSLKQKPSEADLGFGRFFTDHLFAMDYTPKAGWHDARV